MSIIIEKLSKSHSKESFECGIEELNRYLKLQAKQDMEKFISVAYVAYDYENSNIMGYYTLSSNSIDLGKLPEEMIKRLPKYPIVPTTLLGRLAISNSYKGRGLGEHLLMDAIHKTYTCGLGSFAMVVDAKNDNAKRFYEKYDFQSFHDNQFKLFLTMKKISKLFTATD